MPMKRMMVVSFSALTVLVALWLVSPLMIREMASDSMKPLIRGQGAPPSREGDRVLILTSLRFTTLKKGDLVLVEIPTPTGAVEAIRRIKGVERGERLLFTLESIDPIGIDSRQFGPLAAEKLKGKVLHVFKS